MITVTVWHCDLDAPPQACSEYMEALVSDETVRAMRYTRLIDRRRFLRCRSAVRHILAQYLSMRPREIPITYGPFGKPLLTGESAKLSFNVSHSERRAAIAVAFDANVGVDIEIRRPVLCSYEIARMIFTDAERQDFQSSKCDEVALLKGWTRKEAVLKALGTGFVTDPQCLSVSLTEPAALRVVSVPGVNESDVTLIDISDGPLIGAVAVFASNRTVRVQKRGWP